MDHVKNPAIPREGHKTFVTPRALEIEEIGVILNNYDLAYLHVIERRGVHADIVQAPEVSVTRHFREVYKGVLLTSSGYDRADALTTVDEDAADMVAFGRSFIANPDFVERLRVGADLNPPNMKTLFPAPGSSLAIGYTDYPFMASSEK
ncbi:unnamed protein product [Phytophthora lilii]|uniref:Unnamed protein product n=1 Tax=Phytophthora lilii TaxID=2077276 RepID=A0A9W6X5U1_9STRA|nr:unnamed protein product [Phytophthora lilii]